MVEDSYSLLLRRDRHSVFGTLSKSFSFFRNLRDALVREETTHRVLRFRCSGSRETSGVDGEIRILTNPATKDRDVIYIPKHSISCE